MRLVTNPSHLASAKLAMPLMIEHWDRGECGEWGGTKDDIGPHLHKLAGILFTFKGPACLLVVGDLVDPPGGPASGEIAQRPADLIHIWRKCPFGHIGLGYVVYKTAPVPGDVAREAKRWSKEHYETFLVPTCEDQHVTLCRMCEEWDNWVLMLNVLAPELLNMAALSEIT